MPVELADLDFGADRRMKSVDAGERDVLLQDRRTRRGRDLADLRPADMDAVTMADGDIGIDVEPDQLSRRVFLAPDKRLAADEIVGLGFQRHGEADARLERI